MKIVVLTTQTLHHTYFVRELTNVFPIEAIFVERKINKASFETHHPFEDDREAYEREVLFDNKEMILADFGFVIETDTINNAKAVAKLIELGPDVIIVFGTGRIKTDVIAVCPDGIVNFHGGNPEEYRGLDSHLWAVYHRDYDNLIVTLHRVNDELDDGQIILQAPIGLKRLMKLHQLRQYNTQTCLQLAMTALDIFERNGKFFARPQQKYGRYYSFMPNVLKDVCKQRFEKYTETLD